MKPPRKTITALFGYDRRERRGTFVLSLLLAVMLLLRIFVSRPGNLPPELPPLLSDNTGTIVTGKDTGEPPVPFPFDPNTAGYDTLLELGLTERQARTLINYRSSGAIFRKPADLMRVYGIDSATSARLLPYIIIGEGSAGGRTVSPGGGTGKAGSSTAARGTGPGQPGSGTALHGSGTVPAQAGNGTAPSFQPRKPGSEPFPPVDLNTCTTDELELLPGIGPVLAARIIRYRSLLGGFVEPGQLAEVYGLDSAAVGRIHGRVTLTYDSVRPVVLDSIPFGDIVRHPYLGYEAARRITRYRAIAGRPLTLGDMAGSGVITPDQALRMAPYVKPPEGLTGSDYEFISSKVLK